MLKMKHPGEGIRIFRPATGEPLAEVRVASGLQLEVEIRVSGSSGVLFHFGRPDQGHETHEDFGLHVIDDAPEAPTN